MPIVLQQAWATANNGGTASNPVAVTWGSARQPGSLLLLAANSDGTHSDPSGWNLDQSQVNDSGLYLWWRISNNTATDAPSLDNNASTVLAWAEYIGNQSSPADRSTSQGTSGQADAVWSTGTTLATQQDDELAVAAWGSSSTLNPGATFSDPTNGFTEVVEGATSVAAATNVGLTVATKTLIAVGTVESTADPTGSCARVALVGTYRAVDTVALICHLLPLW